MTTPEKWKREHVEKMRAYRRRHYQNNKQQYFDRVREREVVAKRFIDGFKSKLGCSRCSENDPRCLDFHHENPKFKTIAISKAYRYGWSINRIKEEIKKCSVLCANCHRKEHM